jgi:hypothetical protein
MQGVIGEYPLNPSCAPIIVSHIVSEWEDPICGCVRYVACRFSIHLAIVPGGRVAAMDKIFPPLIHSKKCIKIPHLKNGYEIRSVVCNRSRAQFLRRTNYHLVWARSGISFMRGASLLILRDHSLGSTRLMGTLFIFRSKMSSSLGVLIRE